MKHGFVLVKLYFFLKHQRVTYTGHPSKGFVLDDVAMPCFSLSSIMPTCIRRCFTYEAGLWFSYLPNNKLENDLKLCSMYPACCTIG